MDTRPRRPGEGAEMSPQKYSACDSACRFAVIEKLLPSSGCLASVKTLRKHYGVSGEQVENTGSCPIGKCRKKCEEQKWRQMLASSPYSKASCARQDRGPLMAL